MTQQNRLTGMVLLAGAIFSIAVIKSEKPKPFDLPPQDMIEAKQWINEHPDPETARVIANANLQMAQANVEMRAANLIRTANGLPVITGAATAASGR